MFDGLPCSTVNNLGRGLPHDRLHGVQGISEAEKGVDIFHANLAADVSRTHSFRVSVWTAKLVVYRVFILN